MKRWSLFLLRLSLALLLLVWGLDKIVDPAHGQRVAETFYLGVLSGQGVIQVLGVLQVGLAVLLGVGVGRRWVLPVTAAILGISLLGVWRSIVDPWGWYLEGTNALFFPSTTVFAAALVLLAFRSEDTLALDHGRRSPSA